MKRQKRIRRKVGDVVAIELEDGEYGYGRVLREPLIAIYNLRSREILGLSKIVEAQVLFVLWVSNSAITHGIWPVLGNAPLAPNLLDEPVFFKKNSISGRLTIYNPSTGEEVLASREECSTLECAAVWSPHHVVDRIRDYFAGRPCKWVECMRP